MQCTDYLPAQAAGRAHAALPDTVGGPEVPDLPEARGHRPRHPPVLAVGVGVRGQGDTVAVCAAQGHTGNTGGVAAQGGERRVEGAQPPVVFEARPLDLAPPPGPILGVTPRDQLVQ